MDPLSAYRQAMKEKFDDEAPADLGLRRRQYIVDTLEPAYTTVYKEDTLNDAAEDFIGKSCPHTKINNVPYMTGTGNKMRLDVHGWYVRREEVPLMSVWETSKYCGTCKGSSGGCPGFSPRFEWLRPKANTVFVIVVTLDIAWTYREDKLPRPSKLSPIINRMSMADRMTDAYLYRLLRKMNADGAGFFVGCGNCAGCSPSKCTVIRGEPCSKPKKRTYSMESVGIDCDKLHYQLYGEYLPWYYKGMGLLQKYVSRYAAFFIEDDQYDYDDSLLGAVEGDKSYIPHDYAEVILPSQLMPAPRGVHEGYVQWYYPPKEKVQYITSKVDQ